MNQITIVVLFAAVAASIAAGIPQPYQLTPPSVDNRIIGGEEVSIADYPFQGAFFLHNSYRCGAIIINSRWTLTAAHCIGIITPSAYFVRLGSSFRNRDGFLYQGDRIVIHDKYNRGTLDYDVSLVRLSQHIVFGVGVQPIGYIGQDEDVPEGELLRVSGFGVTFVSSDDPNALRAVSVPKVDRERCHEKLQPGPLNVTYNMICAGFYEGGRDACSGDSGGPLINEAGKLVGVVSWGIGCAQPNRPGVYARVASVSDWITEETKGSL